MKVELENDFEDNTDKKDVDNTVAKKELPNTGVRVLCITILSVMIIFVIIILQNLLFVQRLELH